MTTLSRSLYQGWQLYAILGTLIIAALPLMQGYYATRGVAFGTYITIILLGSTVGSLVISVGTGNLTPAPFGLMLELFLISTVVVGSMNFMMAKAIALSPNPILPSMINSTVPLIATGMAMALALKWPGHFTYEALTLQKGVGALLLVLGALLILKR